MNNLHWAIKLRLFLLMPFSCKWNSWLRDFTAWLEIHNRRTSKMIEWGELLFGKEKHLEQLLRVMEYEVSEVYSYISKGKFSKPNYNSKLIIGELDDNFYDKEFTQDDIKNILEDNDISDKEKLKEIGDYFELEEIK